MKLFPFVSTWQRLGRGILRWWLRLLPSEQPRLFVLTLVIGVLCGFAAVLFHLAIRSTEELLVKRAMAAQGYSWVGWTVACTTLGGLACGVLLDRMSPGVRGSGIPQVKTAYAVRSGRVRLRDSLTKFGVATLQIGSGSSLGVEGPTVHICAGISTALGRLFALSPHNTRRLLPVGSSAGIAAAFNAPIAAVTFSIEEIIGDIDHTVLSGVVVASALAAVIEHSVLGSNPVFDVAQSYALGEPTSLMSYAALGVAAAYFGNGFRTLLLTTRSRFRMLPVATWLKPAIGGFITGTLAVGAILAAGNSGITGGGYATLSAALAGSLTLKAMLAGCVFKLVATAFSYGSGGAGGIFAPTLFIGGMLGGCIGVFDREVLGHTDTQLGAFALVGMGAILAAVIRAPITSVLIIFEMTQSYGLILPLMIATTTAYVLARRQQPLGIYDALLAQDGVHLPHRHRVADALGAYRVSEAMTTELVTLRSEESIADALARTNGLSHTAYPVLDSDGRLVGVVTHSRLRRRQADEQDRQLAGAVARTEVYLSDHESLADAATKMHDLGARQMFVVDLDEPDRLVGVLALSDVVRAYARAAATRDGDLAADRERREAASFRPRDTVHDE